MSNKVVLTKEFKAEAKKLAKQIGTKVNAVDKANGQLQAMLAITTATLAAQSPIGADGSQLYKLMYAFLKAELSKHVEQASSVTAWCRQILVVARSMQDNKVKTTAELAEKKGVTDSISPLYKSVKPASTRKRVSGGDDSMVQISRHKADALNAFLKHGEMKGLLSLIQNYMLDNEEQAPAMLKAVEDFTGALDSLLIDYTPAEPQNVQKSA